MIGLGRFGTALACELNRLGTEVLAIDNRADIVQRLAGQISQLAVADTTDLGQVEEVGLKDFTNVVVAIGSDMQASILTTSLLSEIGVANIWAKGLSREHSRILNRVGAHHVVMPEHDMGQRLAHMVADRTLDYVELGSDWVVVKTQPPPELWDEAIDVERLQRRGVSIVSVKPNGTLEFQHFSSETRLGSGDQIVIAGEMNDVERFVRRTG